MNSDSPIAVFDSGVGGLSVLLEIQRQLPNEMIIYFADQAHVPYGSRPIIEVQQFAEEITRSFCELGVKLVVIACNTASAAALYSLRNKFLHIPFVGMEPAVKPAAETTHTGIVGVLATPATFQGALYASVIERFASNVVILQDTCPGLVLEIESGNFQGDSTKQILEKALHPMLEKGIDTVVLGCTHYPFVIPLIQEVVGVQVRVIDPAPAVARQVKRLLVQQELTTPYQRKPEYIYYTSGAIFDFSNFLESIGITNPKTIAASWIASKLFFADQPAKTDDQHSIEQTNLHSDRL